MTHGAGTFSSGGGGGGFSSGGYSAGTVHLSSVHLYSRSRSGSGDGTGSGDDCCCVLCVLGINLVFFLLCIRKMSRLARVVLLWVYVLTLVLTVSLLLRFNILNINKFQSAPTDMAPVTSHLNNAFCQSMKLNSSDPFTAYSFDELPRVDPHQVEQFNTSYYGSLITIDYEYWGFYLLEGSHIVVSASGGSTMYVIKGNGNLQKWIDTEGSCSNCFINKSFTAATYPYELTVEDRDNYYFMFYSPTEANYVSLDVYIHRTLFDISTSTHNCSSQTGSPPCSFEVSLNPDQVIVYHNGRSASVNQGTEMLSTCEPRVWMYFIVFGLLPVLVGVALSFLLWRCCRDTSSDEAQALTEMPK